MTDPVPRTLQLVRAPILLALVLSVVRLSLEVAEVVPPTSGGALNPLGISWLPFVLGPWFAWRLRPTGGLRGSLAGPAAVLLLLAVVAAIRWQFGPLFDAPRDDETFARVRAAVMVLVPIALGAGLLTFALRPRLAWTLLCFAVPTRLVVWLLTWLAKGMGWQTHYTRFGPPGVERDLGDTLLSAAIAQGGFWVPFTLICGAATGAWFAKRQPRA